MTDAGPSTPTPPARVALPSFNDLMRILRMGNEFLSRPQVAELLVAQSGDTLARALKWGVLNRAQTPFTMNVSLPPIDPAWIGVPLYVAKFGGAAAMTVAPTGFALNKVSRPTINDAATFVATAVRLYVFINDGVNWYADG